MLAKSPDVAFYIVNTVGLFKRNGYRYSIGKWIRRNVKGENHNGLSDITGMKTNGIWFSIEVKIPGKEPTEEQWDHINFVNDNGGLAGYATNVLEAEQIIRGFEININRG
jgi:hypothetical protein